MSFKKYFSHLIPTIQYYTIHNRLQIPVMTIATTPSNAIFLRRSLYPLLLAIGSSIDNFIVGLTIGLKSHSPSPVSSSPSHQPYDNDGDKSNNKENSNSSNEDSANPSSSLYNDNNLHDLNSNDSSEAGSSSNNNIHIGNIYISLANSLGAFVASMGGRSMQQLIGGREIVDGSSGDGGEDIDNDNNGNNIASFMAGVAFLYLAFQEISAVELFHSSSKKKGRESNKGECDGHGNGRVEEKRSSSDTIATDAATAPPPPLNTMGDIASMAIPMTLNNIAGGVAGGTAGLSPYWTGIFAFLASFFMMDLGRRVGKRLSLSDRHYWGGGLCANHVAGFIFAVLSSLQFWDFYS